MLTWNEPKVHPLSQMAPHYSEGLIMGESNACVGARVHGKSLYLSLSCGAKTALGKKKSLKKYSDLEISCNFSI